MKSKRFSEPEIVAILREAERGEQTIAELCRAHGIADHTFYRWRRKFGSLPAPELRLLRELEKENVRLKRLVVDRDLEIDALRELVAKNY
ncbi:MAG: transposase [Gemmatimonadales bacterium]|nr:MAG: transposase [Gemmatimonadales bacterium]